MRNVQNIIKRDSDLMTVMQIYIIDSDKIVPQQSKNKKEEKIINSKNPAPKPEISKTSLELQKLIT